MSDILITLISVVICAVTASQLCRVVFGWCVAVYMVAIQPNLVSVVEVESERRAQRLGTRFAAVTDIDRCVNSKCSLSGVRSISAL